MFPLPRPGARAQGFALAPTDAEAEAVYERVVSLAAAAGLVVQAYGGVATLATPTEQRRAGLRERTLAAVRLEEQTS